MTEPGAPSYEPKDPAVEALTTTAPVELLARRAELQAAAEAAGLTPQQIEAVLNNRPDLPRPLLSEERDPLLAVLRHADFPGRDALLAQAETAEVVGYCGCGCATVQLAVDRAKPRAAFDGRLIPNEATVVDAAGEPIGGVIVFVDDGYLSLLEVYSHDKPISPFPPLERLQLVTNAAP